MAGEIATGKYTGTGAAVNVVLGFVPDYVRVINATDGDVSWEWTSELTDGHAFQTANHDATQQSVITSNGVSKLDPKDFSTKKGFTAGSALSESEKVFIWFAARNGNY